MLSRKKILVAASIAGLMASSTMAMAGSAFPGHDSQKKCCNMCGSKSSCKMGKNGCSGKSACSGKNACKGAAAKVEDGKLTT